MMSCQCKLTTKVMGDGCKYCNPQYYIEILEMQQDELQQENERLRTQLSSMPPSADVLVEALIEICVKCRSNEWGPLTPRKEILNWMHDKASEALGSHEAKLLPKE